LATEPSSQRAYRAACPNCGAPVDFRSAASAFAVCSFCKSTIVREGDALRKIGQSADLFDDHSPLQLGAAGKYQGAAFTLVGRLQYRYADGTWNEWHALFDNEAGKSGWLSEDNGRYVFAFEAPLDVAVPPNVAMKPGAQYVINGQGWSVASVTPTKLIAAQGELPYKPNLERGFLVCDLRSTRGEVGTLDYADQAKPRWSIGRSVAISELAMTGLADGSGGGGGASEKTLKGRSLQCPNCGAALEVKLATTQSIVCHQCHSVVDVSQGVGGDLQHYTQENGLEPLLPLGSVGTLTLSTTAEGKKELPWQVVGYVERCEVPESSDDEQTFWREYLLYHRSEGFAFIVDADDGWSWTVPITGVPQLTGDSARHEGAAYRKLYDYTGQITYVLGEFYWQLTRNQRTYNTDFQGTGSASSKRLNRERTVSGSGSEATQEIVWSAGEAMPADVIMKAFRLAPEKSAALQRDAAPTALKGSLLAKIIFWAFIVFVLLLLFRCGSSGGGPVDCSDTLNTFGQASQEYQNCLNSQRSGGSGGYRTGGGSFGGFSSGGGHK
jgi:ribosomal protein L37AE/L43A